MRQPLTLALVASLIIALLGACASDSAPMPDEAVSVASLQRLVAAAVQRIGSAENADTGFSQVGSLAIDSEGRLVVFEAQDMEIRVYDAAGRYIRAMGRRGDGPGEFRNRVTIGTLDSVVWAVDRQARRLTVFHIDGTLIGTHRLSPPVAPLQAINPFRGIPNQTARPRAALIFPRFAGSAESLISGFTQTSAPTSQEAAGANDTVKIPRVRYAVNGSIRDTVGWIPFPPPTETVHKVISVGDYQYVVPSPPPPDALLVETAEGYIDVAEAAGESTRSERIVRVRRFSLSGGATGEVLLRAQPVPYDDATLERTAWIAALNPGVVALNNTVIAFGERPRTPLPSAAQIRARDAIRAAMQFPSHQRPAESAVVGDDGSVWLRMAATRADSIPWIILDRALKPRGTLVTHYSMDIRSVTVNGFWSVERDDAGVPWIVRYSLQ